jgi:GT2 family glycosyltransferase
MTAIKGAALGWAIRRFNSDGSGQDCSVSLVISTRNRAPALALCLDSVTESAKYAASRGVSIEGVIVDNGSTDSTSEVVAEWASRQTFPVALVFEGIPGSASGRNAGLSAARGEIFATTDDDCRLASDFIWRVHEAFSLDPVPSIRGGRIELGDPEDLPITIKTGVEYKILGRNAYPGGFLYGANLCLHSQVFKQVGGFDCRFGAGAHFPAGEDTDYLVRAQKLGIPMVYDPAMVVHHFHGRKNRDAARRLHAGYFFGDGALVAKHFLSSATTRKFLLKSLAQGMLDLMRPKSPGELGRWRSFRAAHMLRGIGAYLKDRKSVGSGPDPTSEAAPST